MAKNDEQIARLEQELKDLLVQADRIFDDFEKKMTGLEKKRSEFLLKISQEKDQESVNRIINSLKT